jgi:hypothetical protein
MKTGIVAAHANMLLGKLAAQSTYAKVWAIYDRPTATVLAFRSAGTIVLK